MSILHCYLVGFLTWTLLSTLFHCISRKPLDWTLRFSLQNQHISSLSSLLVHFIFLLCGSDIVKKVSSFCVAFPSHVLFFLFGHSCPIHPYLTFFCHLWDRTLVYVHSLLICVQWKGILDVFNSFSL